MQFTISSADSAPTTTVNSTSSGFLIRVGLSCPKFHVDVSTSNYFNVLRNVEIDFDCDLAMLDESTLSQSRFCHAKCSHHATWSSAMKQVTVQTSTTLRC
ncbi:unnamed protein product [Peronospora belbahrii]|uniref:Uncharacterized protein n=1 Tax=Peronospora belbahrii TaxID=622444 RepID=A0ABN8D5P1_9STRA|nr:unnamed protein product [Peronospora belbahrii]